MVAELSTKPHNHNHLSNAARSDNRVLHVLIRRHGTSQTFGENLIFMLNRAGKRFFPVCSVFYRLILNGFTRANPGGPRHATAYLENVIYTL
jgi:hypothetical protein